MPLLPALEQAMAALSAVPDVSGLSITEARARLHEMIDANFTALALDRPPVASEVDHRVPTDDGGEITVRVYTPDVPGPLPCHVYFHGGGFWLGTLDQGASGCRGVATDAACVVASVDYRLAPEHRFPTAVDDAYAALRWVERSAATLGVDPTRISVGGGSAGGNLAAVVALMARDRGGPVLVLQVLEIAVLDFTRGPKEYADMYLREAADATDPYASPLLADDLSGVAPALVMAAELDTLAAEDLAYAARLRDAGVAVEERLWDGQFHGSQNLAKLIPDEAAAYHRQVVDALRRAYGY